MSEPDVIEAMEDSRLKPAANERLEFVVVPLRHGYCWAITSSNGRLMAMSPRAYPNETNCRRALQSLARNMGAPAPRVMRATVSGGISDRDYLAQQLERLALA